MSLLLGGDEIGRTQGGNNNAYCQTNEISWLHWDTVDADLLAFMSELIGLRKAHPALRPPWFRYPTGEGVVDWVKVLRSDGKEFADEDWDDPRARSVMFVLGHDGADAFALLFNAAENVDEFEIPAAPHQQWQLAASSDPEQEVAELVTTLMVRDASFSLLRSARID